MGRRREGSCPVPARAWCIQYEGGGAKTALAGRRITVSRHGERLGGLEAELPWEKGLVPAVRLCPDWGKAADRGTGPAYGASRGCSVAGESAVESTHFAPLGETQGG